MMQFLSNPKWLTTLASWAVLGMLYWVIFLVYDARRGPYQPSFLSSLKLFGHMIPTMLLFATVKVVEHHNDNILVWFIALVAFRYWRTVVNIWFWFQYQPALPNLDLKLSHADCTVILPTVGPEGNPAFAETVSAILFNRPSRLIFATNSEDAAKQVEAALPPILSALETGKSDYQREWRLKATEVSTDIAVTNAKVSNKRRQVVNAFDMVETAITIMVDDTAVWHPQFLEGTLPAFGSDKVGFVGTSKWVKRLPRVGDPNATWLRNLWKKYWSGFWNTMGALYLIRHNFEIRATNAADGGVFCVSGRTSLIRTCIVADYGFQYAFLNEFVLRLGERFRGFGPIVADDDNFLTRWIINHGWDVKIQCSKEATITTPLGKYPKFVQQCQRWSRTTFRQNPIALFADRTIWWKWPLTVWTTYFPWMYNAALFWDVLMVYALMHTNLYQNSEHRIALLYGFAGFIYSTKLVKTAPWFWQHPGDFFLYFFPIPAYPLFAYYHSLLKIWTALTFWDLSWSGRKL
ncbi:glycosyltransferase family 2 protein [Trematosphaeria pertusa]|uniref:Glycosyltransferase family 2 protein n=1 Tax=Trematosphaeria pertusa TaxID=390896 RepID=A0A6A6IBF0_9PLEO|nr:glycosyltransferase family 2 protein [Trematosphaeria pertusa]KAF2247242.1 glycosyltransferase family 2 protein [Trematosphaeria pertusa]